MSLIEPLNTPHRARLTVADFLVLDRSGAFDRYAKTELIGGRSSAALRTVGSDLRLTIEVAVRIDAENLPEPDMILTSFRGEGPVPCETVALVVEVSDTTLRSDLGKKAGLYAAGKIAESWVVGRRPADREDVAARRCRLCAARRGGLGGRDRMRDDCWAAGGDAGALNSVSCPGTAPENRF